MGSFPVVLEIVGVGAVVSNVVNSQKQASQTHETGQTGSHPTEVAGKVEEHVNAFHGVGGSCLLEVLFDVFEGEDAGEVP